MSRDDSVLDPSPTPAMVRSGGLKGRIRRALSFNAASTLREDDNNDNDDDVSIKASTSKTKTSKSKVFPKSSPAASGSGSVPLSPDAGDVTDESPATTPVKKRSRAASLFNSRLNASTDNISLSSTVSSASVMIRKLGKLARRNSLAGITSLFKDKKDKDDADGSGEGEGSKKGGKKNKRSGKGEASEASVSHVTAELDRMGSSNGDWTAGAEMSGLSPAAKLARQHTLKSNAEAAARAKAQQEADAAAAAAAATAAAATTNAASKTRPVNGAGTPLTWERNTATRQASPVKGGATKVTEDGTIVLVEDDDSASEDGGSGDEHYGIRDGSGQHQFPGQKWDDDDEEAEWEEEEDEDVTIRVGLERTSIGGDDEEMLAWAVDVRRSIDRTRKPSKGILKGM
jgi:hypothetical protein